MYAIVYSLVPSSVVADALTFDKSIDLQDSAWLHHWIVSAGRYSLESIHISKLLCVHSENLKGLTPLCGIG
jgi:hypothetical protein